MILGIGAEADVFLCAVLAGMTVLAAYYILICFRKIIPHRQAVIGAEDLVFWIAISGYLFDKMYRTTSGVVRWFFAAGVLFGFFAGYLCFRLAIKMYVKAKKNLEKYFKKS